MLKHQHVDTREQMVHISHVGLQLLFRILKNLFLPLNIQLLFHIQHTSVFQRQIVDVWPINWTRDVNSCWL